MTSRSRAAASLTGVLRASLAAALLASAALAAPPGSSDPPNASDRPGAQSRNGFVLDPTAIDASEIQAGGPPRDGIPALDSPERVAAAAAEWDDGERVIGVQVGSETRAYPLSILVWHELVNDVLGGKAILVSFCPLCGTGMVFDRRVGEKTHGFGVSGLLYRSDMLLFDRETESLWSQISQEAVTGPSLGQRLGQLRSRMLSWGQWRELHPETTVLTRNTGHSRRYGASPYGDYDTSERLAFPAPWERDYHPKTWTVGLRLPGGGARAYPSVEVERAGGVVRETFAGHQVQIFYDSAQQSFVADVAPEIEVVEGYWFAWSAFHPDASVFTHQEEPSR